MSEINCKTCEPNVETACGWWPDLRDIWTPVGWQDHAFRFNVLFNGTILAAPWGMYNGATRKWKDLGAQYTFSIGKQHSEHETPGGGISAGIKEFKEQVWHTRDTGEIRQGWNEGSYPAVLWSEWANSGILIKQEIFAHVLGGKEVATGTEPLFAWVRFSISYICPALPVGKRQGIAMKIESPHFRGSMAYLDNIRFRKEDSAYPRDFILEKDGKDLEKGAKVVEVTGLVRLGIMSAQECRLDIIPPSNRDMWEAPYCWRTLYLELPVKEGAHFDLLLPMLPVDKITYEKEAGLGYAGALKETESFWKESLKTQTHISTPEPLINDVLKHVPRTAAVLGEKSPEDGAYAVLTGSHEYSHVWATPTAMSIMMCLDTLGYHDMADRYLELFRKYQGTMLPPGKNYSKHPGYLTTPQNRSPIDWLNYHGAILWAASEHALLTGDKKFIGRWLEPIIKGCEFIGDARRIKGHGGVEGLMPPAVASDRGTKIQSVWNDGWCYKGLVTAARFLRRIGDERAEKFIREAGDYRAAFCRALREKSRACPAWTAGDGKKYHFVPASMGCEPGENSHAFYLDAGPLFLVFAGLLDAGDELMEGTLRWFREGPQTRLFRSGSDCWQAPVLVHEISSCEPCYSWNIFHALQAGDRLRYLEGMFSIFAGSLSRQTFTMCESRGGITGVMPTLYGYLARVAMIEEIGEELHLLRLAPLSWISAEKETVFENIPTEFGPVTLRVRKDATGANLVIAYEGPARQKPAKTILHVPPLEGLKKIILNGKTLAWDGVQTEID